MPHHNLKPITSMSPELTSRQGSRAQCPHRPDYYWNKEGERWNTHGEHPQSFGTPEAYLVLDGSEYKVVDNLPIHEQTRYRTHNDHVKTLEKDLTKIASKHDEQSEYPEQPLLTDNTFYKRGRQQVHSSQSDHVVDWATMSKSWGEYDQSNGYIALVPVISSTYSGENDMSAQITVHVPAQGDGDEALRNIIGRATEEHWNKQCRSQNFQQSRQLDASTLVKLQRTINSTDPSSRGNLPVLIYPCLDNTRRVERQPQRSSWTSWIPTTGGASRRKPVLDPEYASSSAVFHQSAMPSRFSSQSEPRYPSRGSYPPSPGYSTLRGGLREYGDEAKSTLKGGYKSLTRRLRSRT